MNNILQCPLCNATIFEDYLFPIDYLVSKKQFKLQSCKSCRFVFTNPIPQDKDLPAYYKSAQYLSHSDSISSLKDFLYFWVRKRAVQSKWKLVSQYVSRGTLLDYGCGTGFFISKAESKEWSCIGFEPEPEARNLAIKRGCQVHSELNEIKNTFDVITLWHVLEHVPNLKQRINQLQKLIKSKGYLVLALPNRNSLDARHYKSHWAAYDVPRHLYHFTQSDVHFLMSSIGFKPIKTIGMKADAYYVSLLSEQYKKNPLAYAFAFFIGLASNIKAFFTKEYSSRIYIYQKP